MQTNAARWARPLGVLAAAGLLAVGCASSAATSSAPSSTAAPTSSAGGPATTGGTAGGSARGAAVYPGAEWDKADAASLGFDQAKLDAVAAKAKEAGSNCFLVVRNGKIAGEWYWNGTDANTAQEVFSATKSYTSALVGQAQADGKLSIDDKASKYIPQWAGTPADAVTIKNLISNDSGRHWDFQTDYVKMAVGADDKTAFAEGLAQDDPPGTVWVYNNSAIQTLSGVLQAATGEDVSAYAKRRLLDPIGMTHSELAKDRSGHAMTFMGLQSTCRDMARFGWLYANKGNWNGNQVVPAAWVDESTGKSSTKLNAAYGYLWWLNRTGKLASPDKPTTGADGGDRPDAQMVPGAPEDKFWALGMGSQIIDIDPAKGVIAVRLAPINVPKDAPKFTQVDTNKVSTEALVRP